MEAIKMNESARGSKDGINVEKFEKGRTYVVGRDITPRLAEVFVEQMKVAEHVEAPSRRGAPVEEKAESGAPDNKDAASEKGSVKEARRR